MIAVLALALAAPTSGSGDSAFRHCHQVHAHYAIYANRDGLRVLGSKHVLDVAIDALDKELEARGWEKTVAYGDFTVCSERPINPRKLSIRDTVRVTEYSHVIYESR